MSFRGGRWTMTGLAVLAFVAACNSDTTDPLTTGNSARIVIGDTTIINDTTLLTGEALNYGVDVSYPFSAHGKPLTVFWSLSDTSIATLDLISDGSAYVTAKKAGTTILIAYINKKFTDSTSLAVVPTGSVRWRATLAATPVSGTAVDDSDRVFVSAGANLVSFTLFGAQRWSIGGCFNSFSPSVRLDNGAIHTSGAPSGVGCTKRHAKTGDVVWTSALGSADNGVALTADDGVIIVGVVGTPGGSGATVVSKVSAQGNEVWRDTLIASPIVPKSNPAIASTGDIYVPWKSDTANQLTRLSAAGAARWTIKLPAWARYTGPAVVGGRMYVAYEGGVSAIDTTGAVVWSTPIGTGLTPVSSPVVDEVGNVYVQSGLGLYSFSTAGALRWHADSLAAGTADPVPSPSIIAGGAFVVPCGGEVCAVRTADGSLVWRSALGGGVASAVSVGSDGTLFATRVPSTGASELVALWSHAIPLLVGWPTEGHDAQRSRREF